MKRDLKVYYVQLSAIFQAEKSEAALQSEEAILIVPEHNAVQPEADVRDSIDNGF